MKFKIGQKVRVVSIEFGATTTSVRRVGDTFTIKKLEPSRDSTVVCQDDSCDWCDVRDLIILSVIHSKLLKDK